MGEPTHASNERFVREVLGRLVISGEEPGKGSRSSDMALIQLRQLPGLELRHQGLLHRSHTL
jgi:hypothetical protein